MKILNLHTCPNGLFSKFKNPNGGLEKVVYDFHILMQEFGVDIISVCSPSDWCVEVSGFIPINPNSSVEWSNNWKPYCNALYTMIERERPDRASEYEYVINLIEVGIGVLRRYIIRIENIDTMDSMMHELKTIIESN